MPGKRKHAAFCALLLVSLAVLLWWHGRGDDTVPPNDSAPVAATREGEDSALPGSAPKASLLPPAKAGENSAAGQLMSRLEHASSAQELEAALVADAAAGDTFAMAALAELTARCRSFWPSQGDRFHPRREVEQSPAGSRERLAREAALNLLQSFCDRPYAAGEATSRFQELSAGLDDAAKRGDLVARAYKLFEGESESAVVGALQATDDPWVAEQALIALAASNGPLARQLDAEVFPSHLRDTARHRLEEIKVHAARWNACAMGPHAGPISSPS